MDITMNPTHISENINKQLDQAVHTTEIPPVDILKITSALKNEYPASTQKNIEAAVNFARKISRTEITDDRFLRVARLYMSVSQVKI